MHWWLVKSDLFLSQAALAGLGDAAQMAKDMFLSGGDYEASLDMAHAVYLTQGQQHVLKLIKNVDEFSAFHGRPRPPLYEFFGDAAYSGVLNRVFFPCRSVGCKGKAGPGHSIFLEKHKQVFSKLRFCVRCS